LPGPSPGVPAGFSVISITIETVTIRLSQLLKLANVVQDGAEAKFRIANKEVRVNGDVEIRRGRKLRNGDQVEFAGKTYEVVVVNPAP
jgi:ribosome-associated protein